MDQLKVIGLEKIEQPYRSICKSQPNPTKTIRVGLGWVGELGFFFYYIVFQIFILVI